MDFFLEKLKLALNSALEGMSDEQMRWHPAEKWCAAEVLEHLYLSYTGTVKGFERVRDAGKPLAGRTSIKQRLQTFMVLSFNYLPEGRKAPKNTVPRGLEPAKVKAGLAQRLAEMDGIIAQCEAAFGRVKLLDHPILGPLTAAQWRKFHWIHGRHHARQIVKLREQASNETPPR